MGRWPEETPLEPLGSDAWEELAMPQLMSAPLAESAGLAWSCGLGKGAPRAGSVGTCPWAAAARN